MIQSQGNPEEIRRLVDSIKNGATGLASLDADAFRVAPFTAARELREERDRYREALEKVSDLLEVDSEWHADAFHEVICEAYGVARSALSSSTSEEQN